MNEDLKFTKEMEDWFNERTHKHIALVQKYANMIAEYKPEIFGNLVGIVKVHDASKLNDNVEKIPYIFISWDYHCKDLKKDYSIPKEMKEKTNEATMHHVKNNKHHPEYWAGETAQINKDDRDAVTKELVDATKMPDLYLGEMMADWMAMAEEKGNTVKDWADKVVNKRWKFTDEQKDLIYDLIKKYKGKEMRFDEYYLFENIVGYRNKFASKIGKYGTFYTLKQQDRPTNKVNLNFNNLLILSQNDIKPFEGLPSEYLANKWFKNFDFWNEANKIGMESGELMDKMVTQKAIEKGYDGILFGDTEIVDLKDHPLYKELQGK